ncbi:MAG: hypothetical protein POELPBGB_02136 [Bacteroidia bacterium]|nr:hypothetical protein [Bacteroidia bacterium]
MKKLILFVLVLVAGNVRGQTYYPCSVLPLEFQPWCDYQVYLDTLDLSEDSSIIIIDTANSCNTWVLGHSYKTSFDSILSPLGLVTDTILPYTTNVKCSFIVKQTAMGFYPNLLFFEHKFETDSLLDGGYIEYSCDHGEHWRLVDGSNIVPDGPPQGVNYFNYLGLPDSYWQQTMSTIHDTVPAFTGISNDWQWSGLQIVWFYPVMRPDENRWDECWQNMDTLYMRFTFESDSIDSGKAGWMIRNIVTGWNDLSGSISEFSTLPLKLFPNPATENISLELPPNSGTLSSVVISDIAGKVIASPLTPLQGESGTVDVSTLSSGIYFVLAETDKFVFRQKLVKQ